MEIDDEIELQWTETNDAWAVEEGLPSGTGFSTKVPPGFDGGSSWFANEEMTDDWLDMTTIEDGKKAPLLKSRLIGLHVETAISVEVRNGCLMRLRRRLRNQKIDILTLM